MSLINRNGIWWAYFTPHRGKRIRRSTKTTERAKAQQIHDKWIAESWDTQVLGKPIKRTWRDAAGRWLKESTHLKTIENSKIFIRWLDSELNSFDLDDITKEVVDQLFEKKRKETVTTATVNHYLGMLRIILRKACYEWEWISRVPKIKLLKLSNKRIRWLTHEEADKLLSELPTHLRVMARFTLCTGLRRSNVLNLRWSNVYFDTHHIVIHGDESKTGKPIAVPLNDEAAECLKAQLGQHKEYVFTYNGHNISQCTTKAWKKALKRAGISDFKWHDLRHTWASWHVQAGTSLHILQQLGGWSSFDMVLRYAHLSSSHLLDAAKNLHGTKLAQ